MLRLEVPSELASPSIVVGNLDWSRSIESKVGNPQPTTTTPDTETLL